MNSVIADRISVMQQPAVGRIIDEARRLEANGTEVTYLVRGEPDFVTPANICDAAMVALKAGMTHYPPTNGIRELRRAIADRLKRDFQISVDPDKEVIVTTGATMGLYIALQSIINPGDEVIVLNPSYDPYSTLVQAVGGIPITVSAMHQDGRFYVPIDAIESSITKRTKAILVNNPWNPTGTVMTFDELKRLADLTEAYGLMIVSDEIYEKIVFDGHRFHPLAAIMPSTSTRIISINSFSKTYAMTGWRLGYNIASPDLITAMLRVAEQFSRSAAEFVQFAGIEALNGPQNFSEDMVNVYARRRALLTKCLREGGISAFYPPEGTFFVFLDLHELNIDSTTICNRLLRRGNVVTIPGDVYGSAGEGFVRLSFAYNEEILMTGIGKIICALEELRDSN